VRAALQIAVFAALFLLAVHLLARMSLYHPVRYPEGLWEMRHALGAADVELTASDGVRLHGWWINPEGARTATLFLHGNAGNVTHRGQHMAHLRRAGSAVLVIDYRGYGRSEGSPSEAGLVRDARAGYDWLRAQGWDPERIVIHGESLGSTVAVLLAASVPCAGVVLEAPFPSVQAVAAGVLPVIGPLAARGYNAGARIHQIRAPLLVIHGDRDGVIPQRHGRRLFELANEPKEFWSVPGADHNGLIFAAGEEYVRRLARFHEEAGGYRGHSQPNTPPVNRP
jgi:fermentation-respiration switch protein FrsA (DUF1100 family)